MTETEISLISINYITTISYRNMKNSNFLKLLVPSQWQVQEVRKVRHALISSSTRTHILRINFWQWLENPSKIWTISIVHHKRQLSLCKKVNRRWLRRLQIRCGQYQRWCPNCAKSAKRPNIIHDYEVIVLKRKNDYSDVWCRKS